MLLVFLSYRNTICHLRLVQASDGDLLAYVQEYLLLIAEFQKPNPCLFSFSQ